MRFLSGALALAGAETALAHTPDASHLGNLFHQVTSFHHLPAAIILAMLLTLLVMRVRRNRVTS